MTDEPSVETINRREAASGRVSYGDPVVIHDSAVKRVTLVPFFVPRSDGVDLAIRLVSYRRGSGMLDWVVVEEKSLSLDEAAARRLLQGLRSHLRVADEAGDGAYIVVRVAEGTAQLGDQDPQAVARALATALSRPEIVTHLAGAELGSELIGALRGAIRLSEMRNAVARLRELLESGEASEASYQQWCDQHSWAFGNAYVMRDEVRNVAVGDQIDLLLPTVISGYRDIVELKRPDASVLLRDEAHRNWYFSADVSKAIGQCHRYLDILHEAAAVGLRDHPEIVAYHPRATIVIGRSNDWDADQQKALHGLNRRLSGITVMTYDHLLAQGERLLQLLGPADDTSETDIDELASPWVDEPV